jgi:ribonuclease VapC
VIVDSSALLAILLDEPEAVRFAQMIADAEAPRIPPPNWVEVALVTGRRDNTLARDGMDSYVEQMRLTVAPFLASHAVAARQAWDVFGRGKHRAKLNFGDCMAYGFARVENQPLLFKGGDFGLTDIEPALKD